MPVKCLLIVTMMACILATAPVADEVNALTRLYFMYYAPPERVAEKIAAGADVNERDSRRGATPLIIAIRVDRLENMQVLLDAGADVDRRESGKQQMTPLIRAVVWNEYKAARMLLEAGYRS